MVHGTWYIVVHTSFLCVYSIMTESVQPTKLNLAVLSSPIPLNNITIPVFIPLLFYYYNTFIFKTSIFIE